MDFKSFCSIVKTETIGPHAKRRGYASEGENIGTSRGMMELLELVVILLFWFFDTPSKV